MFSKMFSNKMFRGSLILSVLLAISMFMVYCSDSRVSDVDNPGSIQPLYTIYFEDNIVDSVDLHDCVFDTVNMSVSLNADILGITNTCKKIKLTLTDSGSLAQIYSCAVPPVLLYEFLLEVDSISGNWFDLTEAANSDAYRFRVEIDGDTMREKYYLDGDSLLVKYHEDYARGFGGDYRDYTQQELDFIDSVTNMYNLFMDSTSAVYNNFNGDYLVLLLDSEDFWQYICNRAAAEFHWEEEDRIDVGDVECALKSMLALKCLLPGGFLNPGCYAGLDALWKCYLRPFFMGVMQQIMN